MKYLSLALACGLMLSACGGTDDIPVPPPPGLEGLWQARSADDLNDAFGSISIDSGDMYVSLENAADNPIDGSFYTKSSTLNCLESFSDKLTHVGSNRYRDSAGDIAVMVANGNTLLMTLTSNGSSVRVDLQKSTSLSATDLQTCGIQNDTDNLVLNDDAGKGFLETIFSNAQQ